MPFLEAAMMVGAGVAKAAGVAGPSASLLEALVGCGAFFDQMRPAEERFGLDNMKAVHAVRADMLAAWSRTAKARGDWEANSIVQRADELMEEHLSTAFQLRRNLGASPPIRAIIPILPPASSSITSAAAGARKCSRQAATPSLGPSLRQC